LQTVNIHAAKTQLSRLVEEAASGAEIIIAKAGKPMARLVPLAGNPSGKKRRLGLMEGKLPIPEDFDTMLSVRYSTCLKDVDAFAAGYQRPALVDRQYRPAFARTLAVLEDDTNGVLFSAVSIWEIAIKSSLGRPDFAWRPDTVASIARETAL
jgi:prevent-host-death family protein